MESFVTGATGFIGRHLVPHLLARGETVHVLVRRESLGKLEALRASGATRGAGAGVVGDLGAPCLGVSPADRERLAGRIDHFFHLAALYDMEADEDSLREANVGGTRHMLELVEALDVGCLHHVSSIAAAGRYPGTFREDMFEEATDLDDPYFATKHESEGLVRVDGRARLADLPTGHRRGATARRARSTRSTGPTTSSARCVGCGRSRAGSRCWASRAGPVPIVPVDYVARALDVIAHESGLDGRCFHLVDPARADDGRRAEPVREGRGAPAIPSAPRLARDGARHGAAARRARGAAARRARVEPRARRGSAFRRAPSPTWSRRASTRARRSECWIAMACAARIFASYAPRLWAYWERHLDPEAPDRKLETKISGKRVLITGASSGIGARSSREARRRRRRTWCWWRGAPTSSSTCSARSSGPGASRTSSRPT